MPDPESLTSAIVPQANGSSKSSPGFRLITWQTLPALQELEASTILCVSRRIYVYSPEAILKTASSKDEALITELANEVLGSLAPRVEAFVSVLEPRLMEGILMARRPGVLLVDVWPSLDSPQRTKAKTSLIALLVRMRAPRERFDYYGRPGQQPYITPTEFGWNKKHDFCRTRADWDESRMRALRAAAEDAEVPEDRIPILERVQHETGTIGATLVDAPVLTHGDLSDRNILVDPITLEVTGLIDWELANIAPAYFEYATARLCGGHLPEWRKELLEVLCNVLQAAC